MKKNQNKFPTARLVIIGNEVLKGQIEEVNSTFLIRELFKIGIQIKGVSIIEDDRREIIRSIKREKGRCTYLFVTGGIGPTHDDMTRQALAEAFNCPLQYNKEIAFWLENYYGDRVNEKVLSMAFIPEKGGPLGKNPALPGFEIENVFVLPGYPHFMKAGFKGLLPTLKGGTFFEFQLFTPLDESIIADLLEESEKKNPPLIVGSYPSGYEADYQVRIHLWSSQKIPLQNGIKFLKEKIGGLGIIQDSPLIKGPKK